MSVQPRKIRSLEGGFTLLEVLVAMAVLAIATMTLTGLRTTSVIDAAQARDHRIARSIATRVMSEIEAGVLRAYELRGVRHQVEELPSFEWKIVVGEGEIQQEETERLEASADISGSDQDRKALDRREWLNRRHEIQRARRANKPIDDLDNEELEVDESPDEDSVEEVAVYVYWPNMKPKTDEDIESYFRLRGQATTLALSGLTKEQAETKGDGEESSKDGASR